MSVLKRTISSVVVVCYAVSVAGLAGCADRDERTRADVVQQQAAGGAGFVPNAWRAPADSEIPHDSLGASVRRGLALVMHTTDSLPAYAPGNINCTNCHLNGGRN